MSYDFTGSTSESLRAAAVLTAVPMTFACWFNSDNASAAQTLMYIGNSANATNYWRLMLKGNVAGDPVEWQVSDGVASHLQPK